jgi:membrane associated rhomboid family serine protease
MKKLWKEARSSKKRTEMNLGDDYEPKSNDPMIEHLPTTPSFTSGEEEEEIDLTEPTFQQEERPSTLGRRNSISEIVNGLGKADDQLHPALERRIRDFKFAQKKRTEKYGSDRPWGILGLYDHLASIRIDLEWAEDAAWRRQHTEPYLSWGDFEKARAKGTNRPFFTYFILLFCTIMLVVSIGLNGWKVEPLSENPMIGPSAETLLQLGAKQSSLIVNEGEWYRLFSPMVLHAGIIHYCLNMMALWFVGSAIEQSHGFVNAAIAFIIAGVGGTVLSALFLPQYISVGASGGIFGFIGMCISDIFVNWNLLFVKDEDGKESRFRHAMVILWLVVDILINCVIGLTPFVDNFTHLGGLVYGFLCGLSTIERLEIGFFGVATDTWTKIRNNLVRFAGLIVSVILIMTTTVLLVDSDGATSPCSECRYVSCVPFPPWSDGKCFILACEPDNTPRESSNTLLPRHRKILVLR